MLILQYVTVKCHEWAFREGVRQVFPSPPEVLEYTEHVLAGDSALCKVRA